MNPTHRFRRAAAIFAAALLCAATGAAPASATVIMEVRDLPGSLGFLPGFIVQSSTPVSLSGSSGDGFASGSVSYDSLGLHASIHKPNQVVVSEQRFGVWAILRYEDLQITTDDGAGFVNGVVNLEFDGSAILQTSSMGSNRVAFTINPGVSTNSSGDAGTVSRTIWIFGDESTSNGFLSGWDGNGSLSVSVPVSFSTTAPEFLQIELRIIVHARVQAGQSGSVDVNFADTLRLADPSQVVSFTSGLNPTLNATTGEIVNNAIAVPEPAGLVLALLGFARLASLGKR